MSMRVISWEEYLTGTGDRPLSVTIGVFDGVHRGHQALLQKICSPDSGQRPAVPAVVTFRENPLKILRPGAFAGDILSLERKLEIIGTYGVGLVVLIDFSEEFSKIRGKDFIGRLLVGGKVKLIALGRNFRCGCRLDTGAREIQSLAGAFGAETWVAPPVMDEGRPVSSSRIRQALAAGRVEEAERLLGRPLESNN